MTKRLTALQHSKQSDDYYDSLCSYCIQYVQANYNDCGLSATVLDEKLQYTPYYISLLFKRKYGISLATYIAKVRIEHAKNDLTTSRKSIKQIAKANGFINSNAFIRNFQKFEGMTPGKYRKLNE